MTKHMKRYVASLTIKEMQIKTTMKYHLLLVRTAIIKKSINNKYWRGCGEKGTLLHCRKCKLECRDYKLEQPPWTTIWRFLKKLNVELPYDPEIPLLGIYLKKFIIQKDSCTPMFIAATIYNRTWKQSKCPTDECI